MVLRSSLSPSPPSLDEVTVPGVSELVGELGELGELGDLGDLGDPDLVPSDPQSRDRYRTLVDPGVESAEEVTRRYLDLPRALRGLLRLVSRTEALALAAQRQLDELGGGSVAGYERRVRQLEDLLVSVREAALRSLEVGQDLVDEVVRSGGG